MLRTECPIPQRSGPVPFRELKAWSPLIRLQFIPSNGNLIVPGKGAGQGILSSKLNSKLSKILRLEVVIITTTFKSK